MDTQLEFSFYPKPAEVSVARRSEAPTSQANVGGTVKGHKTRGAKRHQSGTNYSVINRDKVTGS